MIKKLLLFTFVVAASFQLSAQDGTGLATFNPIINEMPATRSNPTPGRYTQKCVAQYQTRDGWSNAYNVNVNFMSGTALNNATNTFNYSTTSVYGVIFWDKGQASVIKITTYLPCGGTVDRSCINSVLGPLKGKDQDGDVWRINTNNGYPY
ncbi:hypothetical protein [Maribellus sediminis]|uniref:hypothetical protein n=1 Tax=Maribellus sediminis TaxID=2696285 RepID=UPI001430891E|nr:hypothetical protein [Maribellus sediminis]